MQQIFLNLEPDGQIIGMVPADNILFKQENISRGGGNLFNRFGPESRAQLAGCFGAALTSDSQVHFEGRIQVDSGGWQRSQLQLQRLVGPLNANEEIHCSLVISEVEGDPVPFLSGVNTLFYSLYNSLCHNSPLILAILTPETDDFLMVNETFVAKTGFSREQVQGKNAADIGLLGVSDFKAIRRELRNGAVLESREVSFRRNDGRQLGCLVSGKKMEVDGRSLTFLFAQDISETQDTQYKLAQQAEHLEAIFQNDPNILILVNEDARIEKINNHTEKFTGRGESDARNRLIGELIGCLNSFQGEGCGTNRECDSCPVRSSVLETLRTGSTITERSAHFTFIRDGKKSVRDLLIDTRLIMVADKKKVLLHIKDVTDQILVETEREQLKSQLNQMQKMESIGRLASGVAHDLNNLLVPILGYSQILYQDIDESDPKKDPAKQIYRAGLKARELLNQLLAFSRKQELEFRALNLSEVVMDFEGFLRRTVCEDISLRIRCYDSPPLIKGDKIQLEQVMMNLAVNAQDAMSGGGELNISTSLLDLTEWGREFMSDLAPGRWVLLSVRDNGCGMEPSVMEKMYEPFFTTKPEGKGTGLGLSTVYGIVRQHDGVLNVSSVPGEGTDFRIFFPVLEDELAADGKSEIDESPRGNELICVVEDDRRTRELLCTALQRAGYRVVSGGCGDDALEMLERQAVDLLLTDVVMPGMSGVELARKAGEKYPGLRVLYISGYSEEIIADRGVLMGARLLDKPFSISKLLQTVRRVLNS